MPQQLSITTIMRADDGSHRFILVRANFPGSDREYVWCGRGTGWQPWNTTTELLATVFHSEAEAKQAANKTTTYPLNG